MKPNSFGGNQFGRIIDKSNGNAQICAVLIDGILNKLVLYRATSGTAGDWYIPFPASYVGYQAPWRHIVITYDESVYSNTPTFYMNGVEVAETQTSAPGISNVPTTNTDAYHVGNRGSATRTFDGVLDDVRIYNRILTADEVKRLYELGK